MRSRLSTYSRETHGDRARFSTLEDVCNGKVGCIICRLVISVGTGALGVDDTLGNALTIEVGEEVDKMKILEEKRSVLTYTLYFVLSMCISMSSVLKIACFGHRAYWVRHWDAVGGGVKAVLVAGHAVIEIVAVDVTGPGAVGACVGGNC